MNQQVEDPIVMAVLAKYAERSQRGIEKYGAMLTRTDLNLTDWLNHLQEELMDATLYIEKLKQDVKFIAQKTGQDDIIDLMNSEYDEMLNEDKDNNPFIDRLMEKMNKEQNDRIMKLMEKDKG
jgi:succinate dehydrogenase flavin-adding protein (antitoxin of CptAB toxin-antitoxin module)